VVTETSTGRPRAEPDCSPYSSGPHSDQRNTALRLHVHFGDRLAAVPNYSDETIADALDGIQRRRYLLPAIQREFVWGTFGAGMVLIPVAYYVHHRDLDDRYLSSAGTSEDRQRVRDWTVRALLMPGIFGSGLNTLLARLRRAIDDIGADGFPSDAIEDSMAAMGKSLRFDPPTVDELANSSYGQPDTFALLSIVYGHVDPARTCHIDHIFPRDKLRRDRLREVGYTEEQVERIVKLARDSLANLQLLPGGAPA
jgi:hypothetical protein